MLATTFQHKGHTVEIHYDEDGGHADPRDSDCNVGTILGFPHRSYSIGDSTFDPREVNFHCAPCDGTGEVTFPVMGEQITRECSRCQGYGNIGLGTWDDVEAYLRSEYDIVGPILKVGMIDHSSVHYYIGGGAHPHDPGGWDSGTCGVTFATRKQVEATGVPEDKIVEALTAELDEYSKWANGEVYGYIIKDRNDDIVESCWGFIGHDYVEDAAKEDVPDEQPAVLHRARFTDKTLDVLTDALSFAGAFRQEHPTYLSRLTAEDINAVLSLVREVRTKGSEDDED